MNIFPFLTNKSIFWAYGGLAVVAIQIIVDCWVIAYLIKKKIVK